MLYGTLEQFITLILRNGWARRKANMGMGGDEILSEIATSKYQVQFLPFAFSLNFLPCSQKMLICFYSYTNKQTTKRDMLNKSKGIITIHTETHIQIYTNLNHEN